MLALKTVPPTTTLKACTVTRTKELGKELQLTSPIKNRRRQSRHRITPAANHLNQTIKTVAIKTSLILLTKLRSR